MTQAAVKWSLQELSAKLHYLKNNQIKNEEEDDAAEEVNEEHDDDAAEEVSEDKDDAAEEVNEEHGDAAEEENEEEEDAEVNGDHDDVLNIKSSNTTRSVPEYKEDEIQLTKEYMMAINNAAEHWTKKGEHQKIHDE
ncbi:unnamed protein product [Prunus armeniaca]|uniref:Uncharacterized protein n=1 Tax=Prunus armeniaca TaxID=36596 RepID=A0A6J5TXZ1_PRUAR|nr:unnamed protein product [Prunus armeniaca]